LSARRQIQFQGEASRTEVGLRSDDAVGCRPGRARRPGEFSHCPYDDDRSVAFTELEGGPQLEEQTDGRRRRMETDVEKLRF
jgi:hypothetical protein